MGSAMTTRDVMIIRHGATKLNNNDVSVDRIRGWKDIPLSDEGKEEAHRLGKELKSDPPDFIVSSDLDRAAETARIVSKHTGIPLDEVTEGFRPWNVGKLAGEVTEKALPIMNDHIINKPDEPLPEGESFNEFKNRFLGKLKEVLRNYPGVVGIVTHHRGERLLEAWKAKGFPANGDVDIKTFDKKGEKTASATNFKIPSESLVEVLSDEDVNKIGFADA